jgi:hypothetical protein
MKNRIFGLAILIITLVFGMMVLGCDENGGGGGGSSTGGNSSNETVNADGTINLIENKWANGNITSGVGEIVYTFKVTIGRSYNIWWNDAYNGDWTKTLSIDVSAYYSDGTPISLPYYSDGWTSPKTFVSTSNDNVYLRVAPSYSGGTGTFAIVYSTNSNKPTTPILPEAPYSIDADSNSSSSIIITWNTYDNGKYDDTSKKPTGYRIYRSTSSSGSFSQVGSSTSDKYINTGLSNNTTYYYRITAYNSNGESSQSDTVSATTSNVTWTNVTSLTQINGTWKGEYSSQTQTYEGITFIQKQEMTVTINASAKTMTMSQKSIITLSGSGSYFDSIWTSYKSNYTPGTHTETDPEDGSTYTYTIEINESTHTIILTVPPVTQTLSNADIAGISSSGMQINQNGTKMRSVGEGTIMTFTKQ